MMDGNGIYDETRANGQGFEAESLVKDRHCIPDNLGGCCDALLMPF